MNEKDVSIYRGSRGGGKTDEQRGRLLSRNWNNSPWVQELPLIVDWTSEHVRQLSSFAEDLKTYGLTTVGGVIVFPEEGPITKQDCRRCS